MTLIKNLKFKVSNIKHLRCTKEMTFNQQFITKWKESFRKSIGVYEKLIDIYQNFSGYSKMYLITFQCKECGIVVKALISKTFSKNNSKGFSWNNSKCTFSFVGKLHSERECLTKNGYFQCVHCKSIDNTKRFEKVYC